MNADELKSGDVVQIDPNYQDKRFAACLMIVTEPKPWGAQGVIIGPHEGEAARYYLRAKFEAFEWVGRAEWMPA